MENEEKVIKRFDDTFGTETKGLYLQKMPILTAIFKGLGDDLYIQDESYEILRKQKIELESKLVRTFSRCEEMLYTELSEIENKLVGKRELQLFLCGYLVATHINEEVGK